MNITLAIDDKIVKEARQVASNMGKSLNQLIRDYLEQLTSQQQAHANFMEFSMLSGRGNSKGWRFNREELHERA